MEGRIMARRTSPVEPKLEEVMEVEGEAKSDSDVVAGVEEAERVEPVAEASAWGTGAAVVTLEDPEPDATGGGILRGLNPGDVDPNDVVTVSLKAVQQAARLDPLRQFHKGTPGCEGSVGEVEDALVEEGLLSSVYSGAGAYSSAHVAAMVVLQQSRGRWGENATGVPDEETLLFLGERYGFVVVE